MNRALDAVGAGFGLAVASPVLAAAALAIKLDDGGPVFYRQRRVGLNGEEFELVKLRTMEVGAEHKGAGFAVNEGEYKVMGLAAYGRPTLADEVRKLIPRTADGAFRLDLDYFEFHSTAKRSFSDKFIDCHLN